jgi:hypothetical protein
MGADGDIGDLNEGVVGKAVLPWEGIGSDIMKLDWWPDMSFCLIYWMFEKHGEIIYL